MLRGMKRVVVGLTAWNVMCPIMVVMPLLYVGLINGDARLGDISGAILLALGLTWAFGTPITAGLALLLHRRTPVSPCGWVNGLSLLFWLFGVPAVVSLFYF